MLVALTGASGFIGSHLVRNHLLKGDEVRILSRQHYSAWGDYVAVHVGDLAQEESDLTAFVDGVDALYHCAAELNDKTKMESVNVAGTARLIDAAAGRVGRWVQLSSVGAYGPVRTGVVTEAKAELPVGLYEKTKTEADTLVREAAGKGAFEAVLVRPSNVYGEDMTNQSLFQLFSMIDRGLFAFLGPKGASANYVHVMDVVEGLMLCATHPDAAGQTFNLSNWATMEMLVDSVAEALGCRSPRLRLPLIPVRLLASTFGALPKVPLTRARVDALSCRSRYTTDKIQQELGFVPRIPVSEGMADLARMWKVA